MEPYLTVEEVKNRLKISDSELIQLIISGQIEGYDIKHGIHIGVKSSFEILEVHEATNRTTVRIRSDNNPKTLRPFSASIVGKTYDFGLPRDMLCKDWEENYIALLVQNNKIVFWVKDIEVFGKEQTRTPNTNEARLRHKKNIAKFLSIKIDKLDQLREEGLPVYDPPEGQRGVYAYRTELNEWMDKQGKLRKEVYEHSQLIPQKATTKRRRRGKQSL